MRVGNCMVALLAIVGVFISGCRTIERAWDAGAYLVDKASGLVSKHPRTPEEEAIIAEAAKICWDLHEKLKAEGYKESDIENQTPENRERIRKCKDILGEMWEDFAARDPQTYNAIIGALSASERSLVLAYGEGDLKAFNAGMSVLKELRGRESEERINAAIELITELALADTVPTVGTAIVGESSSKMSVSFAGQGF